MRILIVRYASNKAYATNTQRKEMHKMFSIKMNWFEFLLDNVVKI